MLTNNFYIALMAWLCNGYSPATNIGKNLVDYTGAEITAQISPSTFGKRYIWGGSTAQDFYGCVFGNVMASSSLPAQTSQGIRYGAGTTPPTREDWTLEKPIASEALEFGTGTQTITWEENAICESIRTKITNNSDAAVTITEACRFASAKYTDPTYPETSVPTTIASVLMDRTVLDVPVTIEPGESKYVDYTIRFKF